MCNLSSRVCGAYKSSAYIDKHVYIKHSHIRLIGVGEGVAGGLQPPLG